ncbi:hypothetical protein [Gluconobacter morbifer]|uniref:TetR family transcriptional regulator n=1 Tax=Gluconobacter morbifer G707 TaxID=1088869 RepID=G6XFB2_9PROT|nr:hypothetical protein [Gluconobacter morbifer]EHH68870.1 hypothetical protein GMO_01770 [Gluconobacter morbifer G707]
MHDPEFGRVLREVSIEPAWQQMQCFLERARLRGEPVFACHPDTALDILLSTIHFRAMALLCSETVETEQNIRDVRALARSLMTH